MKLSPDYLETFETAKEVKDAILLRMSIIRNKRMMPEVVENGLGQEIEQLKILLQNKFKEVFY